MSAVTTPQLSPTAEATRQRPLGDLTPQDRRLELAGIPTAVLSAGAGSPIVLLHGPGEFSDRFARIIPGLAAEHRVIAPTSPATGVRALPPTVSTPTRSSAGSTRSSPSAASSHRF